MSGLCLECRLCLPVVPLNRYSSALIGCVCRGRLCPLLFMEDAKTKGLRETFAAVDAGHTGTIEFGELEDYVHGMGLDCSRSSLELLFAEIDADRSRSLSFDEFRVLMRRWAEVGK